MSSTWPIATLDQISTNLDGMRVPITKADRSAGTFPYYGASGIVDYVSDYLFEGDALLISEDGANLLARATPIAFPASGRYWVNNHAHVLRFEEASLQRWVELFLESISLAPYITGAAQPKLNQRALNSIPIPVAPLDWRRRVIAILDEAFEGIATAKAHAEQNLRNASELFALSVDDLFRSLTSDSSNLWSLSELAAFRNGINFTKSSNGDRVRIIGVKDFQQNFDVRSDDLEWVTLDGNLSSTDCVAAGDIVFVRSNGNPELIGRCMHVGNVSESTVHSGFTIKLRLHDPRLDSRFLCHYLKSTAIRRELVDGGNGANIKSLNQGTLAAVRVPVPSKTLQHEVVDRIEALAHQVANLKSIYQRKLTALAELKQSLLHQAFTGQL